MFDTILTTTGLMLSGLMAAKCLIALLEVSVEAWVRWERSK